MCVWIIEQTDKATLYLVSSCMNTFCEVLYGRNPSECHSHLAVYCRIDPGLSQHTDVTLHEIVSACRFSVTVLPDIHYKDSRNASQALNNVLF